MRPRRSHPSNVKIGSTTQTRGNYVLTMPTNDPTRIIKTSFGLADTRYANARRTRKAGRGNIGLFVGFFLIRSKRHFNPVS